MLPIFIPHVTLRNNSDRIAPQDTITVITLVAQRSKACQTLCHIDSNATLPKTATLKFIKTLKSVSLNLKGQSDLNKIKIMSLGLIPHKTPVSFRCTDSSSWGHFLKTIHVKHQSQGQSRRSSVEPQSLVIQTALKPHLTPSFNILYMVE
jgi:hypothetical protein